MVFVSLEQVDLTSAQRWRVFKDQVRRRAHDEAEQTCQAAILLGEEVVRWKLGLAWIELARGQVHDALASSMRLVREAPEEGEIYRTIAQIWAVLGKAELSREWAKRAEQLGQVPKTEVIARPRRAPSVKLKRVPDPEIRMRALLGQSLFGERDVSTGVRPAAGFSELAGEISRRRAIIAGIALLTLIGAGGVVRAAVAHRAGEDVSKETETLAHLMETGSVEQVAAAIPRFAALAENSGASAKDRAALARAEATVYRYLDADPARKAKITGTLLDQTLNDDDAVLARALIADDEDNIEKIDTLKAIAARRPKASEPVFLIASAYRAAGRFKEAQRTMKAAEELEPSHLPHLLAELLFFSERDNKSEALRVYEQMNDVQPTSQFTVQALKELAARGWL